MDTLNKELLLKIMITTMARGFSESQDMPITEVYSLIRESVGDFENEL